MPIDLATTFATTALGALTRPAAQDAYGELKHRLFKGKLEGQAKAALGAGWSSFQAALGESLVLRPLEEEELEAFARHPVLARAGAQLLEIPFNEVPTAELHNALAELALPDATPEHFDNAWARFHVGFQEGASESLSGLLRAMYRLRQETRDETKIELLRQLVENTTRGVKEPPHWSMQPEIRRYLNELWDELLPVQLLGITRQGSQGEEVSLSAIYTALDVVEQLDITWSLESYRLSCGLPIEDEARPDLKFRLDTEHLHPEKSFEDGKSYSRPLTALEAASLVQRLVLLGAAGSGKSTFARHLALCLTGEALGKAEANLKTLNRVAALRTEEDPDPDPRRFHWNQGLRLPIFVELRHFVRDPAFPAEGEKGKAEALLAHVAPEEGLREALREALASPDGALILLDGLDETPAAEASRERLRQVVASFGRTYPNARLLVTSRPYAYEPDSPWRLDGAGFTPSSLASFDLAKIQAFVRAWYHSLERRGQVEKGGAAGRAGDLLRELWEGHTLQPLAENPLMLTMMVDLHASGGGHFEGGRAEIYEQSVVLLLDRWNELRDVPGARSVASHLGLGVRRLRQALEALANRVHRRQGRSGPEVGEAESGTIPLGELWEVLAEHRPKGAGRVDFQEVSDYLHQRSGILLGEGPKRFRFPHRTFQEYLAACHLTRMQFPQLIAAKVGGRPAHWREVFLLAAAKVGQTPYMAWALLESILPKPPPQILRVEDPRLPLAHLVALAVEESRLGEEVEPANEDKVERVRLWAERTVELGALPPKDRADSGRVLGLLGDRRRGVGVKDGLPEIEWVEIPGGEFLYGSSEEERQDWEEPQRRLTLPAFEIAKYPVTWAQYQGFVEDGGYAREGLWSPGGWQWKGNRLGPEDYAPFFQTSNHPRVGVSWWEAEAFCLWLNKRTGREHRLPTEEEWERTARGREGWIYSWGNSYELGFCNAERVINVTCAVGSFPKDASAEGVRDLSGNVEEWCSNSSFDRKGRVVRGGSWGARSKGLRVVSRSWPGPGSRRSSLGFRLTRGPRAGA